MKAVEINRLVLFIWAVLNFWVQGSPWNVGVICQIAMMVNVDMSKILRQNLSISIEIIIICVITKVLGVMNNEIPQEKDVGIS